MTFCLMRTDVVCPKTVLIHGYSKLPYDLIEFGRAQIF